MFKIEFGKGQMKLTLLSVLTTTWLFGDITGIVYKDFNFNGVKDGGDAPVIGASVNAVCEDGNTYSATTDVTGAYILTGFPSGNKCRVEADTSVAGVGSGTNAPGSAPLVDVVSDGTTHNISTGSTATYCQANPDVIMAAMPGYYTKGKYSAGGGVRPDDDFGTVFKVPAPSTGEFNANGTISSKRTTLATFGQTGAIWGSAWKKGAKSLFVSAALKRYVPLKDESSATAVQTSAGTIYKIDTTMNPAAVFSFAVIPNVLSGTAATELSNRDYGYNKDEDTVKYTGRMGLGDLEISEDETKLYAVNMYTKELVIIDANNGNILQSVSIPNPYTNGECSSAMVRPWALKVRGSDVFIGSVCEDQVENDVGAAIQKYNGAMIQTVAMTNSLRYIRARGYRPAKRDQDDGYRYKNWNNWWDDAPILTDIEFTNSGDMVLGYNSRSTYNRSDSLRGDIRKMCINPDGTYTDESTELAATTCASHITVHEENPTNYYEFYIGDFYGRDHGGYGHPETASGALAQAPGAPNIIVGMIDATDWWQPGAIGNYDNVTGDKIGAQAVINRDDLDNGGEREPYGAKAGGMGDVELLCDPAPIEIGNLVWVDGNQDGIQDPNEPGIPNIPVVLTCDGTVYGTATTDANGHYYFGGKDNVNLTNSHTLISGLNCELSVAQADVNNKPPTVTDPNGNSEDQHDNDAVASGTDNVISFTTTVSNDHSLDFGITPTIGCLQGQLYDDANNNNTHEATEQVASNVTLKITDSFGGVHIVETDASGNYQLVGIPAGAATVKVDVTDTDITEGSIWYNSTFNVTIPESTPGGTPASCFVQDARLYIPAPIDQDPKDVAVCANPTSITWEGATVSSMSVWHNMAANNSLANAKTFATAGGATVNATMYVTDPNGELNNAAAGTYDGASTDGTDGAFNDPYLTLYLGDQTTPGNGTYNDIASCAANGYDLVAGEKIELVVEFDEEVVLDNWRIRDVDSGDDRGGQPNWNWQDGIAVQAFDANGNPVEIETKIGSAGAGLIKDVNGIVHTDPATYNGGDVAHGIGTTPNSSNGHIVLTSNFVPIKKLVVAHVAGPDVPCQTRSALAMAGFAVCKPLHISGTVYDDENGVMPAAACSTSNDTVDGDPISTVEGTPLNVCLLDANGIVLDKQTLDAGTYDFDTYIKPNTTYKVLLTDGVCTVGTSAPAATLPTDWKYEGEQIDPANNVGHDGTPDGMIEVAVATSNVTEIDFAINKSPSAQGYTRPSELNPDTTVLFDLSGNDTSAYISDQEETTPGAIKITSISGGTLYNGTIQLYVGDMVTNPDFTQINVKPDAGDTTATFAYVAIDNACRVSDNAVFTAPFVTLNIAGNLFLDLTRDQQVNGTPTANSCDNTTPLYVNLVDSSNIVLSSTTLEADGSYAFHHDAGVRPNTNYTIVLSAIQGTIGDPAPAATLPAGCSNLDGENIESLTPNTTDGNPDGKITVNVVTSDVVDINFAITHTVKIGDRVWIEDDNDGDATTGTITPVENVTVTATCDTGTYTTVTNNSGNYAIDVPINSTCKVSVETPVNTSPSAGSDDNTVTDTSTENDKTHDGSGTTVTVGTVDNMTLDFGFASVGNWSGKVSEDTNNDDQGDTPISGVTIELYTDPNCDGNQNDGIMVSTMKTDANGQYVFNNLTAGCYVAVELQPNNYLDVSENEGGQDNDSQGSTPINTISGKVNAGETDNENDFVEEKSGSICGHVGEDTDGDDISNADIANVLLTLFDVNNVQVATTTTGTDGNYCFNTLRPGEYTVVETQPADHLNVSENEGGLDDDHGDDNILNSIKATVNPGETDNGNDFVEEKYAYIGNLFWLDTNANGIVDGDEAGVNGVIVTLMDNDGNVLEEQVTRTGPNGEKGYYLFKVEPNKTYTVRFDYSNVKELEAFSYSPTVGGNNANNVASNGVTTIKVTPEPGESILSLDAGVNCECSNVSSDSGDALSIFGILGMMFMTVFAGLFFVRKEELQV